jgi:hypothetical protein
MFVHGETIMLLVTHSVGKVVYPVEIASLDVGFVKAELLGGGIVRM